MMDGFDFPVEIIRTDRKKSASIQLEGEKVQVRVPKTLSDVRIHDLIHKRSPWIKKKFKEAELGPSSRPKEYVSGETFSYLGRHYRLKVIHGSTTTIKLKGACLEAHVPNTHKDRQKAVQSLLRDWYREHALKRLQEKSKRFSKVIGVEPVSVSIKDYKARWGSCSVKGDISFNWRIIIAPHAIVDYVVVHELCHLLEHNHSARFWKHVERNIPDYRERREWLKQWGGSLSI